MTPKGGISPINSRNPSYTHQTGHINPLVFLLSSSPFSPPASSISCSLHSHLSFKHWPGTLRARAPQPCDTPEPPGCLPGKGNTRGWKCYGDRTCPLLTLPGPRRLWHATALT